MRLIFIIFVIFLTFNYPTNSQSFIYTKNEALQYPNIVIIVSDDQGYADVGFQEYCSENVSTPAVDKLAEEGIIFTNAYASAYVCAPTRAGLLTGRYQQRFGFYRAYDSRQGLPLNEKTLAEYLKEEGYRTGIFGKWHLGLDYEYRPLQRGFDEFYGFLGHGAHDYFNLNCDKNRIHNCLYRNNKIVEDKGYLTDIIAHESCSFIKKCSNNSVPFFLYVPFNAVHWPLQAPDSDVKKFDTGIENRNILLAMLRKMDVAVNQIIETLKNENVYDNTIIFYFSDNGGARKNHSNNFPLRGFKQSTYEGGIRVPFVISWPAKFKPAKIHEPVISLDILPTIIDIIDKDFPPDKVFDGKSLIPVLEKTMEKPLHDELFFDGNEGKWAVRKGRYKLVKDINKTLELYDLENDISESNNIIESHKTLADQLKNSYYHWRNEMGKPMSNP